MESRHDSATTRPSRSGCSWSRPAGRRAAVAQDKTITVFAAASMKNALDDINAAFLKATGTKVTVELCGKLRARAPARAGRAGGRLRLRRSRMDGLQRRQEDHQGRHARQPARQPAGADRAEGLQDRHGRDRVRDFDLAKVVGDGRIATGEVNSVPVGKYAKSALEKLGIWAVGAEQVRHGRQCARRAGAGRRAARRCSASCTRPTPRWSRT